MIKTDKNIENEEMLLEICSFSHDGDYAVFEEKSCVCKLFKCGQKYFITREYEERWDYETVDTNTEKVYVNSDDFNMDFCEFCQKYCSGRLDNKWISDVFHVRRKKWFNGETVKQMLDKHCKS